MANFQTHITGAVVASSLAACAALSLQLVNKQEVLALWVLGTLGGILPDVDSDNSTAIEIIFTILGVIIALFAAQWLAPQLSIVGAWFCAGVVFALVRYVIINIFEKFTVHRGSLHSLLACTMFGLATVHLVLWSGGKVIFAWCAGLILIFGMIVHLCLDEFYSVDFANKNIKRSFGSALKVCSIDYPLATLSQVVICAFLVYQLPDYHKFVSLIQETPIRFLPYEEWHALQKIFL